MRLGQGRLALGAGRRGAARPTEQRGKLLADVKADYDSLRERHAAKTRPADRSRSRRRGPTARRSTGTATSRRRRERRPASRSSSDYDLAELRDYIDWQPFFNAWEMKGKFPDILNNPASGETARKLYDDAQEMLDRIVEENWLTANGVIGLFPANAVGDDIEVYTDDARAERALPCCTTCASRASTARACPTGRSVDFVAPKETGLADHVGGFAVTAGLGSQDKVKEFKEELDDYSAILLESLADRLAEAFAERLHERVRTGALGLRRPTSTSTTRSCIKEQYAGIRPAPGYPACPEHTEKADPVGAARRGGERRHRAHRSRWRCGRAPR